jgi:Rap1a immunity proteins
MTAAGSQRTADRLSSTDGPLSGGRPYANPKRILLVFCLLLFSKTTGFAEATKPLVDDCRANPPKFRQSSANGRCLGVIESMMSIGPFLPKNMKFCPGAATPVFGVGVVNGYFKAHPEMLNPDGDLLVVLETAFREEWPCQ